MPHLGFTQSTIRCEWDKEHARAQIDFAVPFAAALRRELFFRRALSHLAKLEHEISAMPDHVVADQLERIKARDDVCRLQP